jgi:hypothetical protein
MYLLYLHLPAFFLLDTSLPLIWPITEVQISTFGRTIKDGMRSMGIGLSYKNKSERWRGGEEYSENLRMGERK